MQLPEDKYCILFDGVCLLCNRLVQKIIQYDKNDTFRFVALQSPLGQEIITQYKLLNPMNSVWICTPNGSCFQKSEAILTIARLLSGRFRLLLLLRILPLPLLNMGYDFISKNRLSWFGASKNCYVPTPDLQKKFL